MSQRTEIAGWSADAQATAWFQAWLRAIRSGDVRLATLAATELRGHGVDVRPLPESTRRST
jgi:hypothetical protein